MHTTYYADVEKNKIYTCNLKLMSENKYKIRANGGCMTDCYTELPGNIFMFLKDFPSYGFLDVPFNALCLKISPPSFLLFDFPVQFFAFKLHFPKC